MRPTIAPVVAALMAWAAPTLAQDLLQTRFPDGSNCYRRVYDADHLAAHPGQRVVDIAIFPWAREGDRTLMMVNVKISGDPASYDAIGYCTTGATLVCDIEGDGGNFTIQAGDQMSVLLRVGSRDMLLEGVNGVIRLSARTGDDRVFRIDPVRPGAECPGGHF